VNQRSVQLGRSKVRVSPLCLGTHQLGGDWGPEIAGAERALRVAVERGITFFDTATSYGGGRANAAAARALGEVLRTRRAEVQLCAKIGLRQDPERAAGKVRDASPAFLAAELEATLRTCSTDYVDIVVLHFPDPDTPVAETAGALADFVQSGKARAVGLSNCTPEEMDAYRAHVDVAAAQFPFSILAAEPGASIAAYCRGHGLTSLAWAPLAQGLLTSSPPKPGRLQHGDYRQYTPWFNDGGWQARLAAVQRLAGIAASLEISLPQLALSWLVACEPTLVPVVGVQTTEQLDDNLGFLDVRLSADTMAAVAAAVAGLEPMSLLDAIPRSAEASRWSQRSIR
jgi:aryl-alcohol dehydrogenase-like predicted oxidoreductase